MTIRPGSPTLLITDPRRPEDFVAAPDGLGLRLLTRLLGWSLDRQLAAGRPPESNRLLALRARCLVSARTRAQLAHDWEDIVKRAGQPTVPGGSRVPLCRHRIKAAESDIRELVRALETALPTPAHGVAMAGCLLGDGAGPLYNPLSARDLRVALHETIAELDPTSPLVTATDWDRATHRPPTL